MEPGLCTALSSQKLDFTVLYVFCTADPTVRPHLSSHILMCTLLIYDIYIAGTRSTVSEVERPTNSKTI